MNPYPTDDWRHPLYAAWERGELEYNCYDSHGDGWVILCGNGEPSFHGLPKDYRISPSATQHDCEQLDEVDNQNIEIAKLRADLAAAQSRADAAENDAETGRLAVVSAMKMYTDEKADRKAIEKDRDQLAEQVKVLRAQNGRMAEEVREGMAEVDELKLSMRSLMTGDQFQIIESLLERERDAARADAQRERERAEKAEAESAMRLQGAQELDEARAKAEADAARLREELALERQHRDGHLPTCRGSNPEEGRCDCGYLEGTAYREQQQRMVDALKDAARLRDALVLFGRHDVGCAVSTNESNDGAVECTCGFDAALAADHIPEHGADGSAAAGCSIPSTSIGEKP